MLGGLAEFSTAVRHKVDLIVVICNDGCYGAEYRKLAARDFETEHSLFDWPDFAPVADALGGVGCTVRSLDDLPYVEKVVTGRDHPGVDRPEAGSGGRALGSLSPSPPDISRRRSVQTRSGARTAIEFILTPRSVVVIGASPHGRGFTSAPLKNLKRHGFGGRIYAVNPRHTDINGIRCYPDVASLPEVPDTAVVVVGARRVSQALTELRGRGNRGRNCCGRWLR